MEISTQSERRTTRLRRLLASPRLEFLLEAHDGLSAKIVEEAGFAGIWASGLAISAQLGVRDANEASWSQVVEVVEFMADATDLPILLDGDTGYGNFNNMRRLVRKLEQRGVAGVCIEDKLFPKTNSFIDGERQPLAEVAEFCGKIRAGKDSQRDPDFCIVARCEAFIAGWGLEEALRRAEAYAEAGADAVLIHSRRADPSEVLAFLEAWDRPCPVVLVPTKYYSTPTEVFRRAGASVVIWANHLVRAAAAAMQAVAREIREEEAVMGVEDRIAPVEEIFRLQGAEELRQAERRYLDAGREARAVVLAATRGEGLESVTRDRPKGMVEVAGRPLLHRLVGELRRQGVRRVTVVGGYRAEAIDAPGAEVVVNPDHATTGELASLARARDRIGPDTVILYGDLLFRSYVLRDLLEAEGEVVAVVDSAPGAGGTDRAYCTAPDDRGLFRQPVQLLRVADDGEGAGDGRWIGMLRVRGAGRERLLAALDALLAEPGGARRSLGDLLNHLVASGQAVQVQYIHGHWLDVNRLEDLPRAGDFAHGKGRG
ncbi:MAG: phosphoenolpyruvate mutase [Nitrospirae bacterium]|nr:MAG: phosphoenolpyruvate mutase [Nitrospirota bacterium]